jgi:hypothetical protein
MNISAINSTPANQSVSFHWKGLPEEVKIEILWKLSLQEIAKVRGVSRTFNELGCYVQSSKMNVQKANLFNHGIKTFEAALKFFHSLGEYKDSVKYLDISEMSFLNPQDPCTLLKALPNIKKFNCLHPCRDSKEFLVLALPTALKNKISFILLKFFLTQLNVDELDSIMKKDEVLKDANLLAFLTHLRFFQENCTNFFDILPRSAQYQCDSIKIKSLLIDNPMYENLLICINHLCAVLPLGVFLMKTLCPTDTELEWMMKRLPNLKRLLIDDCTALTKIPGSEQLTWFACFDWQRPTLPALSRVKNVTVYHAQNLTFLELLHAKHIYINECPNIAKLVAPKAMSIQLSHCPKLNTTNITVPKNCWVINA